MNVKKYLLALIWKIGQIIDDGDNNLSKGQNEL